jgi:hypothetical protein
MQLGKNGSDVRKGQKPSRSFQASGAAGSSSGGFNRVIAFKQSGKVPIYTAN